jgi:hypothetical protein
LRDRKDSAPDAGIGLNEQKRLRANDSRHVRAVSSLSPTIFDEGKDGKDKKGKKIKVKEIPAVELDDLIHQATRGHELVVQARDRLQFLRSQDAALRRQAKRLIGRLEVLVCRSCMRAVIKRMAATVQPSTHMTRRTATMRDQSAHARGAARRQESGTQRGAEVGIAARAHARLPVLTRLATTANRARCNSCASNAGTSKTVWSRSH